MLAPTVTKRLTGSFAHRSPSGAEAPRNRLSELTNREHAVVRAVARGPPNAEIDRELFMSEATVKAHLSRVQAAVLVHDAGLLGMAHVGDLCWCQASP